MLNYLWAFMMIIGIVYGALSGNMEAVSNGALNSAAEAVNLCIKMLGIIAMWTGIMHIGEKSGLVLAIADKLSVFISFLFPRLPKEHPARKHIATNMIANILGLGWAATPAGLKAMEELRRFDEESGGGYVKKRIASNEMCVFLILNISSLQLIPVNMIAYRSQYGSAGPASIIAPALIATFISTVVSVVFCRLMDRRR